jgi:hypothetical protein
MKTLTKSLHTVTAVSRVALELSQFRESADPVELTHAALNVLGYSVLQFSADDTTIAACVAATAKLLK